MKATIELYDSITAGTGNSYFRHNVTLYTPRGGAPSNRQEIEGMVTQAIQKAKESKVSYWHNSLRIARLLIAMSTHKKAPLRLFPAIRHVPTSRYLWRIFLLPEEGVFELAGYKAEYERKVIHRLTPLSAEGKRTTKGQENT